jgi:hypothetical protein
MTSSVVRRVSLAIVAILVVTTIALLARPLADGPREDTPQRFARLCQLMMQPLPAREQSVVLMTEAEAILAFEKRIEELKTLGQQCRDLGPIAETVHTQLARALEIGRSAKGPGQLIAAGVEAGVGLSIASPGMVESGSKGVLEQAKGYIDLWQQLMALRQRLEVERLKLIDLAPRFSGPASDASVLVCEFTEEHPSLIRRLLGEVRSFDSIQTLTVTNATDRDLTSCLLVVRLVEPTGESYQHLYFTPNWPQGEVRSVAYDPHLMPTETSIDVTRVRLRFFAAELSSEPPELLRVGETWPATPEPK